MALSALASWLLVGATLYLCYLAGKALAAVHVTREGDQ